MTSFNADQPAQEPERIPDLARELAGVQPVRAIAAGAIIMGSSLTLLILAPFLYFFAIALFHLLIGDLGFVFAVALTFLYVIAVVGLSAQVVLRRLYKTRRLVVWLRRFHRKDLSRFHFAKLLEWACRGNAVPVTLQDTTVRFSSEYAKQSLAGYIKSFLLNIIVLALEIGVVSGAWTLVRAGAEPGVVIAGAVTLLGGLTWWYWKKAPMLIGAKTLSRKGSEGEMTDFLDRVRTGRLGGSAITILRCPEEVWQERVGQLVTAADAVLIDVSALSENLFWEIRTCASKLLPEQLILCHAIEGDASAGPPSDLNRGLTGALGTAFVERCQIFGYTLPSSRQEKQRLERAWSVLQLFGSKRGKEYVEELLTAILRSFAAGNLRVQRGKASARIS